ncbi:MAG: hypothetical protein AAGL10_12425 [Pseudomonadota bacterium]
MRRITLLIIFAFGLAMPANVIAQTGSQIVGKSWRGDDDFYTVVVAYNRAERFYREFRNRHCAFDGNKKRSLSHVLDTTRERLDRAKLRIEALWPGGLAKVIDVFRGNAAERVDQCDNIVAADLSFGAALGARDSVEALLELVERQRRSEEEA